MLSRRWLSTSDHWLALVARRTRRGLGRASLPAPRLVVVPVLTVVLAIRAVAHFLLRVCFCEPLFKAYCRTYGRNLHTDVFLHWVQGRGDIIVGDDATFDGKCSITFAARYCDRPTLRVGDRSGLNHNVTLVIGREISIGSDCRIASNVWVGRNAIIHPGVTIGEGSIVSAGAVVMSDVPPRSVVAGNPARKIGVLGAPPEPAASAQQG